MNFSFNETLAISSNGGGNFSVTSGYISSNSGGNGSFTNGNGVISSISGGGGTISSQVLSAGAVTYHFKVPLNITGDFNNISYTPVKDDYLALLLHFENVNFTSTGNDFAAENIAIYNSKNELLGAYKNNLYWINEYVRTTDIWGGANGTQFCYPFTLEFDIACAGYQFTDLYRTNLSFNGQVGIWPASEDDYANHVVDSGTQERLDTQIEQEEEAQETRTGILSQITSFFSSFFENIINALKSLFIPEDGYFTNWFNRLNTLLSAKLGMLYAPFDLVISVLTDLGSASTSEAGIPFPELAWDGQVIIPAQTFYFSSLGSSFSDLRDAVYFGTDVVLLFAFLILLQRKINLVMRGSEEG